VKKGVCYYYYCCCSTYPSLSGKLQSKSRRASFKTPSPPPCCAAPAVAGLKWFSHRTLIFIILVTIGCESGPEKKIIFKTVKSRCYHYIIVIFTAAPCELYFLFTLHKYVGGIPSYIYIINTCSVWCIFW